VLARWDVRVAVATKHDDELVSRLVAAGWQVVHTDEDGSILVSRNADTAARRTRAS
jgi:hypothetical protein